jgi:hypothetical protein
MEHLSRQNRSTAPRALARGLSALLGLLMLLGVAGCGGSSATGSAVIYVDSADADWTLPDNYGDGVNTIAPAQPLLILVQKSADDTTPVAGANITLTVGGIAVAGAGLFDPASGIQLDNGFGVLQTKTDDYGAVVVIPQGAVTGCTVVPAADATINGNLSVGIFISSDSSVWNGNFSYTCKA